MLKILNKNLLKKDKIVLLQGENGRKLIEKKLKKEYFKVSVIECYKRVYKILDSSREVKKWRFYKINTFLATSGEILYELKKIILDIGEIKWLFTCRIFVIGIRLSKIAKNLGWKKVIILKHANNEYLLKMIKIHSSHNYFFWSAKEDLNL